jgi:uridine nucleosidase
MIPLDVTHQVLANEEVLRLLHIGKSEEKFDKSSLRALFLEILTFFAATYKREFGMDTGPPLHDPLAVAAALSPALFDDNGGERYDVYVIREGDDSIEDHRRNVHNVGQCGRTIVQLLEREKAGTRIPRTLRIAEFWHLIDLSLELAESRSPLRSK